MNGRPLRSTRTYTLGPYATLFRSLPLRLWGPEALLRPPGRREGIGVPPPSASGRVAGVGLVLEAKHRGQGNRRAAVGERQPRTGSEYPDAGRGSGQVDVGGGGEEKFVIITAGYGGDAGSAVVTGEGAVGIRQRDRSGVDRDAEAA